MKLEQLEFSEMVAAIAGTARNKDKAARRFSGMTEQDFTVALQRSLAAENLSFTTYALMLAAVRGARPPTMRQLMSDTGYAYNAISKQAERTPWFVKDYTSGLLRLTVTDEARVKLERVARRISAKVEI